MAEQNAVATQQGTQLSAAVQVKSMISQDAVKKKFTEVLGQKAGKQYGVRHREGRLLLLRG